MSRISEEQAAYIISLYNQLGNVWKVAEIIDRCGQSVHEFLTRRGVIKGSNLFSEDDFNVLESKYIEYRDAGRLQELADSLGRTKQFICRKARKIGLTSIKYNRTEEHSKNLNKSLSNMWVGKVHPRGMLGKTHSQEYKNRRSEIWKEEWSNPESNFNSIGHREKMAQRTSDFQNSRTDKSANYSRTKKGWFNKDGKMIFMRSSWEINYAHFLNHLLHNGEIIGWDYEVDVFKFPEKDIRSYTPDFKVHVYDGLYVYHEVKGWMDYKSKIKLERMTIYYPEISIVLVDQHKYKQLEKRKHEIKNWTK